jgi:hypothetical protein
MAKRMMSIDRGSVCRVKNEGGISEEIRGQRVRVGSVRADGRSVNTSVQTGPARGASYIISISELSSCRRNKSSNLGFIWPFAKKPAKRKLRVGEKRVYMIRTPSGKLLPVGPSAMQGARRRRKRR